MAEGPNADEYLSNIVGEDKPNIGGNRQSAHYVYGTCMACVYSVFENVYVFSNNILPGVSKKYTKLIMRIVCIWHMFTLCLKMSMYSQTTFYGVSQKSMQS